MIHLRVDEKVCRTPVNEIRTQVRSQKRKFAGSDDKVFLKVALVGLIACCSTQVGPGVNFSNMCSDTFHLV